MLLMEIFTTILLQSKSRLVRKLSQQHHETCPMVLESRWNGVETNTIAIGGLYRFNTIGMVLKILMR